MRRPAPIDLTKPGIYPGVTMAEYLALRDPLNDLPAVRSSHLRTMASQTPAHCRFFRTHARKATPAMELGSAVNHQLLEPAKAIDGTLAIWRERKSNGTMMPRKGDAWRAFEAANAGRDFINETVWDEGGYIAAAVRRNREAARAMGSRRGTEVTVTWFKAERLCVARLDIWLEDSSFLDLKVSGVPLRKDKLAWHAYGMGWHQQAAWYDEALRAHDIHPPARGPGIAGCGLLAVESKPPHGCTIFDWPDKAIEDGYAANGLAFDKLLECERTGQWPGYPERDVLDGGPWREDDGPDYSGLEVEE